ncbi:MAG: type II secretion system protein GspN [Nitrospirae bacterium]|nr:type II secretion system protein GspN [Nitrospirota bacterium]NTW66032.1 type II secretion system protein GspN [Nitrospirota bacterium]
MIDRPTLIRRLSFSLYFVIAFMTFLVILFPFERVKTKLESEIRSRTPLELNIARISPRFLNRFVLADVVLSDRTGRVLFESPAVRAHVSLFGFLRGLLSVDFKAKAYSGELSVRTEQGLKRQFFAVDAESLDLASYALLKNLGLKLSGRLGGAFEMSGDAGKGRFLIKNLASRELKIKGFPVPDLDFEQGWIEGDVKGDRFTIKKLELDGKELKVRVSGDLVMRERGTLNLAVKLKLSERLAKEQAGLLSLLKNRDPEGFYLFSLGGTLAEPMPRL